MPRGSTHLKSGPGIITVSQSWTQGHRLLDTHSGDKTLTKEAWVSPVLRAVLVIISTDITYLKC